MQKRNLFLTDLFMSHKYKISNLVKLPDHLALVFSGLNNSVFFQHFQIPVLDDKAPYIFDLIYLTYSAYCLLLSIYLLMLCIYVETSRVTEDRFQPPF